jgi:hypothetical protein
VQSPEGRLALGVQPRVRKLLHPLDGMGRQLFRKLAGLTFSLKRDNISAKQGLENEKVQV